jgi:Zn-dependent protease with chaperone function
MDPSLWQHQTVQTSPVPVPRDMAVQTFVSGVLLGIVLVATVLLWRRGRRGPSSATRRPLLTGWGALFSLLGAVARGALLLVFGFVLLGRVLFWPAGRRW